MSTTPPGGQPPDQGDQSGQGWSAPPPPGSWQTAGPAPAQPPYGQPGYGAPPGAAPETNGKATAALICGIIGILICGPVGIAAIVLGNGARREIDASGGMQGGRGMATAGLVLGWIAVALMIIGIIVLVLFFMGAVATGGFG